jgi:tetratricopeptide (TPR) repeat protein
LISVASITFVIAVFLVLASVVQPAAERLHLPYTVLLAVVGVAIGGFNWVEAITALGWCKFFSGDVEEAIRLHEKAIQLSPRDPLIGDSYFRIGRVHLVQSRTEEALVWLKKARSEFQGHPLVHAFLASAYALKGATECAAVELAEARKPSGDDRYSTIARLMTLGYWGVPKVRALFRIDIPRRPAQSRDAGGVTHPSALHLP